MMEASLQAYCDFFEGLDKDSLDRLEALFTSDALFIDPFNRVRGPAAVRRIFEHLLRHYPQARFEVLEHNLSGQIAYLLWTFKPQPDKALLIEGMSRVEFAPDGRVQRHQDYWDAASQLYARLPLLGGPTRWLLRRSQACPSDQIVD